MRVTGLPRLGARELGPQGEDSVFGAGRERELGAG